MRGIAPALIGPIAVLLVATGLRGQILSFPTGSGALGMAFDGTNIWIATGTGVTKLRAKDGTNQGTFALASSPSGGMAPPGRGTKRSSRVVRWPSWESIATLSDHRF